MRTGKHGLTAAAVTVVCAVTLLAAPGVAFAAPAPTPAPAPPSAPSAPSAPTSPTSPAPPAPSATATPARDLEAVRKELESLYRAAASATDEYNAAEEKARRQSAELAELAKKTARGQERLDRLRDRAGAAARAQYRTNGLPDEAKLMLSRDPEEFLESGGRVLQGQRAAKGLLGELTRTQQDLETYATDAAVQARRLEANRREKATARQKVEKRVAEAEKLESELEKEEKERLAQLERQAAREAQAAWLRSGILKELDGKATERGREAVEYATAQIGKPYVWGAAGPSSFDCSGLTSRAWAAAGQGIPRTSQEQWRQLRQVDVEDMRPGDLIIYFEDASHVGMYVGDGSVVHAPRPGRTVTIAGAGTMPILGVVRPEA
ncbi:C40 family peptidase [Streptomyces tagetis]|uniref:C40 family peptidase n=1 Tax=Streptomyces tagetis TaxID=2820809 RepID=A0A940XLX7_9ACTN|nr:C40 family peptidase [Streptomyces sp. RG38]MBQ0830835.1 C40 family peptidase [Streptomyces sp. RG38]